MNWKDFKKRQSELPNTTKVGNEYEKLVKIYLSNHPSYNDFFSNVWLLKDVPTKVREHLRLPKPDKRLLLPIDLEIIFNGAGAWNMFFSFLYHTGLRANDVASLKYGNIDFKKKSIVRLVRKSRKVHEFPIADVLINMIDRKADENTPLFPTLISNKETNDKLSKPRKYMQSLLKAHNRPHADLHSFRHTFNQSLLELGMEIEDRQKLLAHASTTTTKIYTHPNFELAMQYVNQVPKYGLV